MSDYGWTCQILFHFIVFLTRSCYRTERIWSTQLSNVSFHIHLDFTIGLSLDLAHSPLLLEDVWFGVHMWGEMVHFVLTPSTEWLTFLKAALIRGYVVGRRFDCGHCPRFDATLGIREQKFFSPTHSKWIYFKLKPHRLAGLGRVVMAGAKIKGEVYFFFEANIIDRGFTLFPCAVFDVTAEAPGEQGAVIGSLAVTVEAVAALRSLYDDPWLVRPVRPHAVRTSPLNLMFVWCLVHWTSPRTFMSPTVGTQLYSDQTALFFLFFSLGVRVWVL